MTDLWQALAQLAGQGQDWWLAMACVFARVGPVFALAPALGERAIPARLRLAAALCMTLVVAPAVIDRLALPPPTPIGVALFLLAETLIGVTLALSLRLMIMALQIAGTKAAQATSLAQFFGGVGVDPQPAMSQVLVMAGLAALVLMGLPEKLALLIVLSYDLFPAGAFPSPALLAEWGVARVGHAFALAFSLAAPFLIAGTLYNLALGAINRAMPQLMVAFVGAPALTLGGLALFLLAAPLMIAVWAETAWPLLSDPAHLP